MPEAEEPFADKVKKLVTSLQFAWFVGHLITVVQTLSAFLYGSSWCYYNAYYGTLLSYGIILYKAHKQSFQLNTAFLGRLIMDENFQYFLISIVWLTGARITVTLIPFAMFSLFHCIGYLRTEVLSKIVPSSTQSKWISAQLNTIMTNYQPASITVVSRAEVLVIFPMTIVSIFWGGASIFIPFLYFQFLQFRYISSTSTKQAVQDTEILLDKYLLQQPSVPEPIKTGYTKAKEMLKKYGDLEARARAKQAPPAEK